MRNKATTYQQELYRLRAHPADSTPLAFNDSRDSFSKLYFSIIPFLGLEYFIEAKLAMFPSGLAFPTAFLLFWAFYYSFYRPNFLEDSLREIPSRARLSNLPALLLGLVLWFVQSTLISTYRSIQAQWVRFRGGRAKSARRGMSPILSVHKPPPGPAKAPELPISIKEALLTLGLPGCRQWSVIHRRYRTLAKQYHPDLNPERTASGREFMRYDAAYRKLMAAQHKYFS